MSKVELPGPLNISMQQVQGPISSGGAVHKLSESEDSLVWLKSPEIMNKHWGAESGVTQ